MPVPLEILYLLLCLVLVVALWWRRFGGSSKRGRDDGAGRDEDERF